MRGGSSAGRVGDCDVEIAVAVLDDLDLLIRSQFVAHVVEDFGESAVFITYDHVGSADLHDGLELISGIPAGGQAERGEAECGEAERGEDECGAAECGDAECGAPECGAAERGVAERGVAECGAAKCGAAECGAAECGDAERGEYER
jgi:hypothetical protein